MPDDHAAKRPPSLEHYDDDANGKAAEAAPRVGANVMPAGLAALSQEEYDRLGRRATLKMDLIIMPIMVIMYILNYLDRQNIASAKLAGIEEDLNLSTVDYQTAVSILFVGYSE